MYPSKLFVLSLQVRVHEQEQHDLRWSLAIQPERSKNTRGVCCPQEFVVGIKSFESVRDVKMIVDERTSNFRSFFEDNRICLERSWMERDPEGQQNRGRDTV